MEESRNLKFSRAKECVKNSPPLTVFCLTDRRLTVSVKPKPTFGSVSELLSKIFLSKLLLAVMKHFFSVGLEVLKSLHVDLTENSFELYTKNDNGLKESMLQKCVITRI